MDNFKFAEAEYYEIWYKDGTNIELCKKIKEAVFEK